MSIKTCVYFGCENYVIDKVASGSGNFTIFQFPKDNERFNLWMELGKVSPKIPRNLLYMCSDHFDPKYISVNSRRRFLLSTAIPHDADMIIENECNSNENDPELDIVEDGSNGEIYVLLNDEVGNETNHMLRKQSVEAQVGSTTVHVGDDDEIDRSDIISNAPTENDQYSALSPFCDSVNEDSIVQPVKYRQKRKVVDSQTSQKKIILNKVQVFPSDETPPQKSLIIKREMKPSTTIAEQSGVTITPAAETTVKKRKSTSKEDNTTTTTTTTANDDDSAQSTSDIDLDGMIDAKSVSTFIFKDVEYVQMGKAYYVEEKLKLIMKIKQYESVLRTMKQYVNALNLH